MRFLRNTEFRVELILLTILFVAAIIGMYMQCGTIAAVYLLIFCGVIFLSVYQLQRCQIP